MTSLRQAADDPKIATEPFSGAGPMPGRATGDSRRPKPFTVEVAQPIVAADPKRTFHQQGHLDRDC
jgi:hypothetical protein